jgi:hypothetical protein
MSRISSSYNQHDGIDLRNVPSSALAREMGRRSAMIHSAARQKFRPCRYCTLPFGYRAMRAHLRECIFNPRVRRRKERANAK